MVIVTQSQVASAPARRQGFVRFAHRLTPPLTAASAPAQRAISSCLTQLLRSFNHWLRHEIPDNSLAHESSGPLASKIAAPSVSAAWLYSIYDNIGGTAQRLPCSLATCTGPTATLFCPCIQMCDH